MRRLIASILVLSFGLIVAAPALAQEVGEEEMEGVERSDYMDPEEGWKIKRFRVGAFAGNLTGSTSLGAVENIFFRTGFDIGSDRLQGARIGYSFAPRFDVELEYGRTSPGLQATVTDLQGQGKTEFELADYDLDYVAAAVSYSVIERSRRIVPFLTLGLGTVGLSSSDADVPDDRKIGILFGAGLRVRLVQLLALRAEARGLRAGFGKGSTDEGALPGVLTGDFKGSHFAWSVGLELRF